jgi:hypothetical protein
LSRRGGSKLSSSFTHRLRVRRLLTRQMVPAPDADAADLEGVREAVEPDVAAPADRGR